MPLGNKIREDKIKKDTMLHTYAYIKICKDTGKYEIEIPRYSLYTCCDQNEDPLEYVKDAIETAFENLVVFPKWDVKDESIFVTIKYKLEK